MLHIGSARFCEGALTSYVRLDARVKEIAVFCPKTEFATDSSLEEGVSCEPVSVFKIPC